MARLSEADRKVILGADYPGPDLPSGNLANNPNLWQRLVRFVRTLFPARA